MATTSKNSKLETMTQPHDDLTVIRGIGQFRQEWLRKTFNVRTFSDLAALSPDAIEAQFKAEKKIVSRNEIAEWIAQAAQHTGDTSFASNPKLDTANWKTTATFVIVFDEQKNVAKSASSRVTIHHMEADETQTWNNKLWQSELYNWMMLRLGELGEVQSEAEPMSEPLPTLVFSPKLAQMIAKTQLLEGNPQVQFAPSSADVGNIASKPASTSPTPPILNLDKDAVFSPRMQQMIAKAQSLEKRKA